MTDQQPPNRFAAFARLRRNFRLRGSMRRAADLVALAYIGFIASMATLTGAYYMLFPELSALSWDVMELPQGRWARAPIMLALTPALTGVIGSVVTRRMPYGIISVLLTVFVCVVVIRVLRSPVAPAISAGLLPLVLGVTSWWYAPCILFGTTVLALLSIPWKRYAATHADNSESSQKTFESSLRTAESGVKSAESVAPNPNANQCADPTFAESPSAADSPHATTDAPPASPPHEGTVERSAAPIFPRRIHRSRSTLCGVIDYRRHRRAIRRIVGCRLLVEPHCHRRRMERCRRFPSPCCRRVVEKPRRLPARRHRSSRNAADFPHVAATDAPPASPPHEPAAHDAAAAIEVPTAAAAFRLLVPLLSFVALAMLAVKLTGMRFILFPPLVVILYEMLSHREHCPWVGRPIAIPVACFASATGGYLFFAHLPFAPLVAMLSMAWGIAVLRTLNLHMPPVLAVALLPLVMTNPTIGYPIAVGLGTMLASAWFEFLARWHWIAPLPSAPPLQ